MTQEQFGQPTIPNIASLAALLELSLDEEGWCLSDRADGYVLAFEASGLWDEIALIIDVCSVTPPCAQ